MSVGWLIDMGREIGSGTGEAQSLIPAMTEPFVLENLREQNQDDLSPARRSPPRNPAGRHGHLNEADCPVPSRKATWTLQELKAICLDTLLLGIMRRAPSAELHRISRGTQDKDIVSFLSLQHARLSRSLGFT
ncbi:MAG: hypothetical protein AAGG57_12630 [Pseudomonadota bacterium]